MTDEMTSLGRCLCLGWFWPRQTERAYAMGTRLQERSKQAYLGTCTSLVHVGIPMYVVKSICREMSFQPPSAAAAAAYATLDGNGAGTRKRKRRRGKAGGAHHAQTATIKPPDRRPDADDENDPTHQTLDSTLDVNFHDFAERYPDFREAWDELKKRRRSETLSESSSSASFSTHVDWAFNVALTRAILCHHFDLSLPSMPEGYLCPPVPNRLNYVLWLNHLLEEISDGQYFQKEESPVAPSQKIGIDIGCGASCIYPLLLTTDRFNPNCNMGKCADDASSECASRWTFLATDIDEKSIQSATINVKANSLEDRIELALVPKSRRQLLEEESNANTSESDTHTAFSKSTPGPVMNAVAAYAQAVDSKRTKLLNADTSGRSISNGPAKFDFCMTNPPFYATEEEATTDRKGDGRSRTGMNVGEGVYPGGEVQFVRDMIADSREMTNSITWYTSMVSRKTSLVELKRELRSQLGRGAIRTATFIQGKTTRWGIAWTYREVAPRSPALRLTGGLQEFDVEIPADDDTNGAIDEAVDRVLAYCQWVAESKKLEVECKVGKKDGDVAEISVTGHRGKGGDAATSSGSSVGDAVIIDIAMKIIEANEAGVNSNAGSKGLVSLKLQCYCYSSSGLAAIEIFRSSLEGEIKRCNRRWRRMLARNRV